MGPVGDIENVHNTRGLNLLHRDCVALPSSWEGGRRCYKPTDILEFPDSG